MLIKNLYYLFCGSESQNARSGCAPDIIEKVSAEVIILKGFRTDIERLTEYGIELGSGLSWIG
jgi:hypothetical protein